MFHFSLLSSFLSKTDEGFLYEDVWTEYAKDLLSTVFAYASLALFLVLFSIGVFVKLKKRDAFGAFLKTATIIVFTFSLTVILTMLALGFGKIAEKGYAKRENGLLVLVPPLVLGGIIVGSIAAVYLSSLFSQKPFKNTLFCALAAVASAFIATVVCLIIYFAQTVKSDGWYGEQINQLALYLSAGGLALVVAGIAFATGLRDYTRFDSRCIALAGITVALSFALSYIKLFSMPSGGSVTLASLVPIMLFAFVYGPNKGVFVGCIYGALQAMQNPYLIHPAQFLLDYPLAFASAGIAGVFGKIKALDKLPQIKFVLGATIAGTLRFAAHVLSGVFAFGADAGGKNLWAYSTIYNLYVFVDIAIVIAVGVLVLSSKSFVKQAQSYASANKAE